MKKLKNILIVIFIFSKFCLGQNFWETTNGPYGGLINCIGVTSDDIVFAGTSGGGLYKSSDNCNTWQAVDLGTPINNVRAITITPDDDIYISTELIFGTSLDLAVYKSTDRGSTWIRTGIGLNAVYLTSMANSNGYIFVGSEGYGIFRSTNEGANWQRVFGEPGTSGAHIKCLAVNSQGHIYAGNTLGILLSTDAGNNWEQMNIGISYISSISISPNENIFATYQSGVIRSTNNGGNWTTVATGSNIFSVYVAPNGSIFFPDVSNGGGSFKRSTNNGASWTTVMPLPATGQFGINSYGYLSDGSIIIGFGDDGIYKSNDGGSSWSPSNLGLRSISVESLERGNSYIYAGTFGGGFYRSIDGINWEQSNQGLTDPYVYTIAVLSNNYIFIGTGDGGLFKSTDLGTTWNHLGFYSKIIFSDQTDKLYAGGYGSVYISSDFGNNWVQKDSGFANVPIQCFGSCPNGYIITGTSHGIYISSDGGEYWELKSPALDVRSISTNTEGHIFIATAWGGGFHKSTDYGESWIQMSNGITSNFGLAIYCHPTGNIYASALGGGVYFSSDNGNYWSTLDSGITANSVFTFEVDNSGHLFAGTWGNSIFRSVNTTGIKDQIFKTPISYELYQNYPNPFNPSTIIKYTISKSSFVSLIIYDLLGKEIATLVNEEKQIGNYEIEFDGSNLASGVYFYRMQAGNFIATKKFILIK